MKTARKLANKSEMSEGHSTETLDFQNNAGPETAVGGGQTGTSEPSDGWREEEEEEKVLLHELPAPQSGGITASAALSLAILTTSAALSAAI